MRVVGPVRIRIILFVLEYRFMKNGRIIYYISLRTSKNYVMGPKMINVLISIFYLATHESFCFRQHNASMISPWNVKGIKFHAMTRTNILYKYYQISIFVCFGHDLQYNNKCMLYVLYNED